MTLDRNLLQRCWLHAHEEDSPGKEVFRPDTHPLPPARGRFGYEFRSDGGSFTLFQIGPKKDSQADGSGAWVYYWFWDDNVGAKNEKSNPTHYKIGLSAPGLELTQPHPDKPTWWQVWTRSSIEYVEWDESRF